MKKKESDELKKEAKQKKAKKKETKKRKRRKGNDEKKTKKRERRKRKKEAKTKEAKKMIWGAVLECIARALRMLGFTRKPVKVLFLGLENAGKTTLMFAMKHGPRGTYDIAHDPTFGLSMPLFFFFLLRFLLFSLFLFSGFAPFALRALRNTKKNKKNQKPQKTKKTKKNKKTQNEKRKKEKEQRKKKEKKQISRRWTWRGTKCARTISVGNSATFGPTTSFRRGASFSSSTRRTPSGSQSPKPNST